MINFAHVLHAFLVSYLFIHPICIPRIPARISAFDCLMQGSQLGVQLHIMNQSFARIVCSTNVTNMPHFPFFLIMGVAVSCNVSRCYLRVFVKHSLSYVHKILSSQLKQSALIGGEALRRRYALKLD